VRSIYAEWERGDFRSIEWADPEIEFVVIGGPTQGQFHGIPEMARRMRDFLTTWEGYRIKAEHYCELDDERILVLTRDTGRGRTSGADTVQNRANVLHLQGGRVTRITSYWDRDRALADLGLEESAMAEESTTPHLVELTRGVLEAASRRDFEGALAPFAPDAVWDMSLQGMGVFEGHTAIRGFLEDWTGAYEDYEIMTERGRDLGNGVTFGVFLLRGRLPGSGGWVELRLASVQSWRQGLIERDTFYTDIDEARAAAERLAEERG
jgi:ketosteroid isomerase-like protein